MLLLRITYLTVILNNNITEMTVIHTLANE